MKVTINMARSMDVVEIDNADEVTRNETYVWVRRGDESWAWPWTSIQRMKVDRR